MCCYIIFYRPTLVISSCAFHALNYSKYHFTMNAFLNSIPYPLNGLMYFEVWKRDNERLRAEERENESRSE